MGARDVSVTVIFDQKGSEVYTVPVAASVQAAVEEMNKRRVGSVVVMDEHGKVAGIFTERDVLVRVVAANRDPSTTPVREVMTADLKLMDVNTTVGEAMELMTEGRARHIPVMDGDRVVGLVSIGDITRWILKLRQSEVDNMKAYLFGEYSG